MSDATVVILVAAIPTTIASLTAAIIALAGLRKSNQNGAAAEETKAALVVAVQKIDAVEAKAGEAVSKIEAIDAKATQIGVNTNGQLSKLASELAVERERTAGFERLIKAALETKRETAAVNEALLARADAAPAIGQTAAGGRRLSDKE